MTNMKLTARDAKQMIGCTVSYMGADHVIEDVRHMGDGGWMLRLSGGAIVR